MAEAVNLAEKIEAQSIEAQSAEKDPEPASLPLYGAGLVIILCGILAAGAALPQPDPGWLGRTLLLSGLGVLFSLGSRQLGIRPQTVDLGFAALVLLLGAGIVSGQVVLEQFLPVGADNNILRLISALVWGSTLWAWTLRSDSRVLMAAIPTMATLGLSAEVDLNQPVLTCFGVFVLTVIFLLIHQNYLQNRLRAAASERFSVPPRLLLAQFVQAGLCGLAVLLAGLVVIVPAQAVFARLSLAQAIRRLAAVRPGPTGPGTALRFSDDDTLSIGTGEAFSASSEIAMKVTASDGQEHYWRGRTYDQYTGEGWQSSLENSKAPADPPAPVPGTDRVSEAVRAELTPGDTDDPGAPTMTATFQVLGDTNQFYGASHPRGLILEGRLAQFGLQARTCRDGRLDLQTDSASSSASVPIRAPYAVVSRLAPDATSPAVQERLREAGTSYPDDVRRLYLATRGEGITQPEDAAYFQSAVAEALQNLPPDRRDPLDEALALRTWVSRRCTYSLAPEPIPADQDHVRVFLRDARRGYCDLFASSLAILCRTAHIPARLATGFAPGDPQGGGSFNLRGEDKHAWTEVYFPGSGWVAFDATAGSATDGSVPRVQGRTRGGLLGLLRRLRLGGGWELVAPLLLIVLLLVGYVVKTEVYDRWRSRRRPSARTGGQAAAPRTALGGQYARLSRALARLGLPRRASETPAEYAARAVPLLAAQEGDLHAGLSPRLVAALSEAFAAACYAPAGAALPPGRDWSGEVSGFEAAARKALWIRLWRRLARRPS